MQIGAAQISPVWLNTEATVDKVIATIGKAGGSGIDLLAFSEALLPGYPFWLCRTNGAAFDDPRQKQAYAMFLDAAIEVPSRRVDRIVEACRDHKVSAFVGANERGTEAARGSVYCSMLAIDAEKGLCGVHRKLVPTFDERLVWAQGDGHGLRVHEMRGLRAGALSCWENWMPLARFSMYAGGEDVHVAAWPGNPPVAEGAPEFIAREGRVYVVSVMGLLSLDDIPDAFPFKADLAQAGETTFFSGGSRIVGPDGRILAEALHGAEAVISAEFDRALLSGERQNLDVSGHYGRPDVFDLSVVRARATPIHWK